MKIKPINNQVLIAIQTETKTKTGLILAGEKKLEEALVLEVSDQVTTIKKGDTVLFKEYSTDIVELDGQSIAFLAEENILGIKK